MRYFPGFLFIVLCMVALQHDWFRTNKPYISEKKKNVFLQQAMLNKNHCTTITSCTSDDADGYVDTADFCYSSFKTKKQTNRK